MTTSSVMFGLGAIMVILATVVQMSGYPTAKVIHLDLLGAIFLIIAVYFK